MIEKTDAIVLRVSPYSNTSHVVTWLTESAGKLATAVKGVQRPKSLFLGQYDVFYTCEVLYYHRHASGLHIAKECTPLITRPRFRSDWRAFACASYITDLLLHTTMEDDPQRDVFRLSGLALDFLQEHGSKTELLFWFEVRLLHALGYAPVLSRCAECRKPLPAVPSEMVAWASHGILCTRCASGKSDATAITPDVRAVMKRWDSDDTARTVASMLCTQEQLRTLQELLGGLISTHLEIGLDSRKIALEMLASD
jgi:DNA repair protein RecO (recombination protein O)